MNSIEWKQCVLIIGALTVGGIIGTMIFLSSVSYATQLEVSIDVQLEEGWDQLEENKLYLKSIAPSEAGIRVVFLQNSGEHRMLMHLTPVGNYSEWMKMDHAWVLLNPAEHKAIAVFVQIPENTPFGTYLGTISVIGHELII